MKKFVLPALSLLLSLPLATTAFASSDRDLVSSEFMRTDWVKAKVASALAGRFDVANKPELALISGSCGFAGCDERFLVTLAVTSKGVNPQTHVISAVATYYVTGRSVTVESSESIAQELNPL